MPTALGDLTTVALVRELIDRQERSVDGLFRSSRRRARRIVQGAMAEVKGDLDRLNFDTWGSAERSVTQVQLARGMRKLGGRLTKQQLLEIPGIVQRGAGDTSVFMTHMDHRFTGTVRPLRFDTLAWWERQNRDIGEARLRVFKGSFERYGAATVLAVEDAIAQNVLLGQPWTAARARVWEATRQTVGQKGWMVDRIIRTETSATYAGATLAALHEEDDPDDPMSKRLVATFDQVTARDSVYVHGQTRPLDEPFQDNKGRLYQAPPNRPNDREVIVGWRDSWGDEFPDYDEDTGGDPDRPGPRGMRVPRNPKPTPDDLDEALARATRAERALLRDRIRTQQGMLTRHRGQLALASGPDRRAVRLQIARDEFAIRQLETQVGILEPYVIP